LKNTILIIDEAHNTPSVCAEGSSLQPVGLPILLKCISELGVCRHLDIWDFLQGMYDSMAKLYIFISELVFPEHQLYQVYDIDKLLNFFLGADFAELAKLIQCSSMTSMLSFPSSSFICTLLWICQVCRVRAEKRY